MRKEQSNKVDALTHVLLNMGICQTKKYCENKARTGFNFRVKEETEARPSQKEPVTLPLLSCRELNHTPQRVFISWTSRFVLVVCSAQEPSFFALQGVFRAACRLVILVEEKYRNGPAKAKLYYVLANYSFVHCTRRRQFWWGSKERGLRACDSVKNDGTVTVVLSKYTTSASVLGVSYLKVTGEYYD